MAELMFAREVEELTQSRLDFDHAVEGNLPDSRARGEKCARMALKLMDDVSESRGASGVADQSGFNSQDDEAIAATKEHASSVFAFAQQQLEEVNALLGNLK